MGRSLVAGLTGHGSAPLGQGPAPTGAVDREASPLARLGGPLATASAAAPLGTGR